jgi:hypothetical protein
MEIIALVIPPKFAPEAKILHPGPALCIHGHFFTFFSHLKYLPLKIQQAPQNNIRHHEDPIEPIRQEKYPAEPIRTSFADNRHSYLGIICHKP